MTLNRGPNASETNSVSGWVCLTIRYDLARVWARKGEWAEAERALTSILATREECDSAAHVRGTSAS